MSTTNEIMLGYRFLMAQLAADSTLLSYAPGGVWRQFAPPGTSAPFVVLAHHTGADVVTANGVRLMQTAQYQVRVSGPATVTESIADAADQCDALLGGRQGLRNQSVQGGLILSCFRDTPLQLDELVSGEQWTNIGGLYLLEIQQT